MLSLIDSKIHQLGLKLHRTRQISAGLPNQVDKLNINQRRSMLSQMQAESRALGQAQLQEDGKFVHTNSKVRK